METLFLRVKKNSDEVLEKAAVIIKNGGLVAFPTETVYGLGANGLDAKAVEKIYEAKGRPSDNPLILHISDKDMLADIVADIPVNAQKLIDAFWPGPLTIIFKKQGCVTDKVTGGLDTVAVRMPSEPVAAKLISLCGVPVAAPSANVSGRPSPTNARTVYKDMAGRIDAVLDGGDTLVGLESTVVDCTLPVPVILRPGGVTYEQLTQVVEIKTFSGEVKTPKAPGMKYRHYAPEAPLYLLESGEIATVVRKAISDGKRVGVLASEKVLGEISEDVIALGGWQDDLTVLATNLYSSLRRFDEKKADIIFVEKVCEKDIGRAIMNRLSKAAEIKNTTGKKDL